MAVSKEIEFYCHVTLLSLSPTDSTDIGMWTLMSLSPTESSVVGFYCHVTLLSLSSTDSPVLLSRDSVAFEFNGQSGFAVT